MPISIADTGPGIPLDVASKIFEPYWSATQHVKLGAGLGLYIAKGIIEGHGGASGSTARRPRRDVLVHAANRGLIPRRLSRILDRRAAGRPAASRRSLCSAGACASADALGPTVLHRRVEADESRCRPRWRRRAERGRMLTSVCRHSRFLRSRFPKRRAEPSPCRTSSSRAATSGYAQRTSPPAVLLAADRRAHRSASQLARRWRGGSSMATGRS